MRVRVHVCACVCVCVSASVNANASMCVNVVASAMWREGVSAGAIVGVHIKSSMEAPSGSLNYDIRPKLCPNHSKTELFGEFLIENNEVPKGYQQVCLPFEAAPSEHLQDELIVSGALGEDNRLGKRRKTHHTW